ncbi:hypothetical protein HDU98_003717 [Podochytrium sp. JEL0797]|nr:hypothetical protein HDU98_003717 [Podochytrium sp. JEL0797]
MENWMDPHGSRKLEFESHWVYHARNLEGTEMLVVKLETENAKVLLNDLINNCADQDKTVVALGTFFPKDKFDQLLQHPSYVEWPLMSKAMKLAWKQFASLESSGFDFITSFTHILKTEIPEEKRNSVAAWRSLQSSWSKIYENSGVLKKRFGQALEDYADEDGDNDELANDVTRVLLVELLLAIVLMSLPDGDTELGRAFLPFKTRIEGREKNSEFLVPSDVFTEIDKILRAKSNDANRVKELEAQVETLRKDKAAAVKQLKRSNSPQKKALIPKDQFVEGCFICKRQCPRAHDPEQCFTLRDLKREGKMDEYESFMKQIKERKRRYGGIGPSDRPKAKRVRVEQEDDKESRAVVTKRLASAAKKLTKTIDRVTRE